VAADRQQTNAAAMRCPLGNEGVFAGARTNARTPAGRAILLASARTPMRSAVWQRYREAVSRARHGSPPDPV